MILKDNIQTVRGTRAGVYKRRSWDTIKGVNFKNLKTVPKSCNTNNYMTVGVVNVRMVVNGVVNVSSRIKQSTLWIIL